MPYYNRSALYRKLCEAGELVASGRCPGWACDFAVCEPDCWSFRCCELIEDGEPLCLRDPSLEPEHGPATPHGDKRRDCFTPIVDWDAARWRPIAVHFGFARVERWDRTAWRRQRYQRRKAWKRGGAERRNNC